uniref:Uncharacterized protein n=1 Tax=Picea sitchensis TaxID=3332 RepID=D5AAW9_PICSI|nr:unknown [Picea sitchensis]
MVFTPMKLICAFSIAPDFQVWGFLGAISPSIGFEPNFELPFSHFSMDSTFLPSSSKPVPSTVLSTVIQTLPCFSFSTVICNTIPNPPVLLFCYCYLQYNSIEKEIFNGVSAF